jgi:hypothetical protein
MISFSFRSNIKEISAKLDALAYNQVPFATALALTSCASKVAIAEQENIKQVMPTATPFTVRSVRAIPATKATQTAMVVVQDIAAAYLDPYEQSGSHLPWAGQHAIYDPVGVALNQYGNIPRRTISRLLVRKDVFMGMVHGVLGIWQRPTAVRMGKRTGRAMRIRKGSNITGKLKLLVLIARPLQVKQHLGYHDLASRLISKLFNAEFGAALARAMATAK